MSAAPNITPLLKFDIEVLQGPHKGLQLSFQKEVISLGRGVDNDVVLSEDLRISRQHIEIIQSHGQFKFRNLNEKNYTLLNDKKVESTVIHNGDRLSLGESEVIFRCPELAAAPSPQQGILQAVTAPPRKQLTSVPQAAARPPVTQQPPAFQQNFQQQRFNGPRPGAAPSPQRPIPNASNDGRLRFYLILGIIGLGVYFFLFNGPSANKKTKKIRGGEEIERSVQQSEENIKTLEERLADRNSLTNKRAEENFIKGFRDYQKGQYLRAREYFQIVLNLSPDHIEARKYYELSRIKFDKQIDYNFIEGLKNKDKKNYRMCRAYFSQVLILVQNDRRHPKYDEAQRYLRECSLSLERRF